MESTSKEKLQNPPELPGDKIYWETNPEAGLSGTTWTSNPLIEKLLNKKMSGGTTDKYWLTWLIEDFFVGQQFESLLSIGCGVGNHEILIAKLGFARQIDAFDFSEASLKIARKDAEAAGVNINFYRDDFNKFTVNPDQKYDIVFCSGSLHHTKELEVCLSTVKKCLKPDGYFIVNEYVGDCYNIYSRRQVELINRIYKCFHASLRSPQERFTNSTIEKVLAKDPSEAIRSQLIMPFLEYYFDIEVLHPYGGGIIHEMYPLLNSDELSSGDPKAETIVRLILAFEEILMELPGGLETNFCLCVLRQKH